MDTGLGSIIILRAAHAGHVTDLIENVMDTPITSNEDKNPIINFGITLRIWIIHDESLKFTDKRVEMIVHNALNSNRHLSKFLLLSLTIYGDELTYRISRILGIYLY